MQLVPTGVMQAPGVCLVCETAPQGDFVVDALREFHVRGVDGSILAHHLSGHKYVCLECVEQIAGVAEYLPATQVEDLDASLQTAHDELEAMVEELGKANQQIAALKVALETLKNEPEAKPRASRK